MMAVRRTAGGGQRCAIICNGICCFLGEDLHNSKQIPEEDCKEYALGVALAQYSIGVRIKKFKECGKAGVSKELTQMQDMQVFWSISKDNLTWDKKEEGACIAYVPEEEARQISEGLHVCRWT
jgi:hypothetical protein